MGVKARGSSQGSMGLAPTRERVIEKKSSDHIDVEISHFNITTSQTTLFTPYCTQGQLLSDG
jgi:hypothetical protein